MHVCHPPTLPREISMFRKRHAQAVKEANRHVKLSHSKTGVK